MSFIIKPSVEFFTVESHFVDVIYLAIKKEKHYHLGTKIELYKEGEHAGLFTRGTIVGKPTKASLIPKEEQHLIYNRSYLQLPVALHDWSAKCFFKDRYLKHLPSLNFKPRIKKIYFDQLYDTFGVSQDIDFLGYFIPSSDSDEKYFLYHFHLLREKKFRDNRTWIKNEVLMNQKTCTKCGIKGPERKQHEPYFFEFHETTPVDFSGTYQTINPDNFEVLCGNCHKLAHGDYFEPFPEKKKSWWFGDPIEGEDEE